MAPAPDPIDAPFVLIDRYLAEFRRHLLRERLLEHLGILAISCLSIFAVAVALVAVLPVQESLRWLALAGVGGTGAGLATHFLGPTRRALSDPARLAGRLADRLPALGRGLQAALSLRGEMEAAPEQPPFSPALLHAEALRSARLLAAQDPEALVSHRRNLRLLATLAVLVATLAALTLAFPWGVTRGARALLGLPDRYTPSWLMGPAIPVDVLAYDLHATLILGRPDGQQERVPWDEGGDLTAPPGSTLEVTGRLTRTATSGELVLSSPRGDVRSPLEIGPEPSFTARFPVTGNALWFLSLSTRGGTLVEKARRRVVAAASEPPKVSVPAPDHAALRPGETVGLRYEARATTGLAGVDAVVTFPLEPDRPPLRTHLKDLPPGTRNDSGEVPFTMPLDAADAGGRVDLVVEVFGRLSRDPADTGRSQPVRFHLDAPRYRRLAAAEDWERLQGSIATFLADLLETEGAVDPVLPPDRTERLRALAGEARRTARETGTDPDLAAGRQVLESVAGWLEEAGEGVSVPRGLAIRQAERATLALGDLVNRERTAQRAARRAELARETTRLREAAPGLPDGTEETMRTLARAGRLVRQLDAMRRTVARRAELEGGTARLGPLREAEASMRARDALVSAEQALKGSRDGPAPGVAVAKAAAALDALARLEGPGETPGRPREVVLSPEIGAVLRQAVDGQREVMDHTAQAAFVLKGRADALAAEKAPDAGRLKELVAEAGTGLARATTDRLDPADAVDVAALREDVSALGDLLAERDFESALRIARDVSERSARLAVELRDQSDWLGDERAADGATFRALAGRLARAASPLRDVARTLGAWHRERLGVVGPADRDELAGLKRQQDRVTALAARVADSLRRAAGDADETVGAAGSARRNMEEASRRLAEANPGAAEAHQRQAIQDLMRVRRSLERGGEDAARRRAAAEEVESVRLPAAAAPQRPPDELGREVREAMREPAIPAWADLVKAYYDAVLRP